jgi:hypothetical protein
MTKIIKEVEVTVGDRYMRVWANLDGGGCIDEMNLVHNPARGTGLDSDEADRVWDILDKLGNIANIINIHVFLGDDCAGCVEFDTVGKSFEWNNPAEWLRDLVLRMDPSKELLQVFDDLIALCDIDMLEDIYGARMSADGYYEKRFPKCNDCGQVLPLHLVDGELKCWLCCDHGMARK